MSHFVVFSGMIPAAHLPVSLDDAAAVTVLRVLGRELAATAVVVPAQLGTVLQGICPLQLEGGRGPLWPGL